MADPAFRGVATAGTGVVSSLAVNKPSGTVDGDVMCAIVCLDNSRTVTTVPSGWTFRFSNVSGGYTIALYTKTAASEGASYTWGFSALCNPAVVNLSYSNVKATGSPVNVSATAIGSPGGANANSVCPSVTTTLANCMIVAAATQNLVSGTTTPPSGMTERADFIAGGTNLIMAADALQSAAGASGTKTFVASNNLIQTYNITFALEPSATIHTGAAVLPATATLSATGRAMKQGAAALATSAALASTGATAQHGASALALSATLATAGTMTRTSDVSMPATATLSADGQVGAILGQAALALATTLSPRAGITQRASQAIAVGATLQAEAVLGRPPPLILKGVRPQAGTGSYGILPPAGSGRRR